MPESDVQQQRFKRIVTKLLPRVVNDPVRAGITAVPVPLDDCLLVQVIVQVRHCLHRVNRSLVRPKVHNPEKLCKMQMTPAEETVVPDANLLTFVRRTTPH